MNSKYPEQAWIIGLGLVFALALSALFDSQGNKFSERLATSLIQTAGGNLPLETWRGDLLSAVIFYGVSIGLYVLTVAIGSHLGFSLAASTAFWSGLVITITTGLDYIKDGKLPGNLWEWAMIGLALTIVFSAYMSYQTRIR